jgi:Ca-activated chloride channel homolog
MSVSVNVCADLIVYLNDAETVREFTPFKRERFRPMKKSNNQTLKILVGIILFSALVALTQIFSPSADASRSPQFSVSPTPTPTPSPATDLSQDKSHDSADDGEVLRVDTTLVTVPVSAMGRDGRYITDLQKADFRLFENGVEQEIAYFAEVEKPFTVVLVLDTSASMWSKLGTIKDAAAAFVEQLRPDDQVAVISFGRGLKVWCEVTGDRQKIRKSIGDVGKGLSTRLYDAMDKVMLNQIKRIQGRKAIVLFTDGVDAKSEKATYESTIRDAEELDALIYPILYDTYDPKADKGGSSTSTTPSIQSGLPSIFRKIPLPILTQGSGGNNNSGSGTSRAEYDRGERYLRQLAELTGGTVYEAQRDLSYLRMAFSNIAEELRRQYSLGYYPASSSATGNSRYRIKVRVNRPDVSVRARSTYVRR